MALKFLNIVIKVRNVIEELTNKENLITEQKSKGIGNMREKDKRERINLKIETFRKEGEKILEGQNLSQIVKKQFSN